MRPVRSAVVRRLAAVTILSSICLSGCSPDSESSGSDGTASSSEAAESNPSENVTPSAAPQTATAESPCPYLDIEFVEETIGQNLSTSIVTTITPPPGPGPKCDFQRPNGEFAAGVDTLTAATTEEAKSAALDAAPGGNPIEAGDGGSVVVTQGKAQTVLGAYQGTLVVTVVINQESSLEAELLAEQVLATLG